jgi:hypothetical protein
MRIRLAICLVGLALATTGCSAGGSDGSAGEVIVGVAFGSGGVADATRVAEQTCAARATRARFVGVIAAPRDDGFLSTLPDAVFACDPVAPGASARAAP